MSSKSIIVFLICFVLIGVGLGIPLLGPTNTVIIGALLTIPIAIKKWPLSAITLVIVATALNRYRFDIAGWGLKIEYIAIVYICVIWAIQLLARKSRVQVDQKDWILIVWLLINLLSSSINAPDRNKSLKYFVLLGLMVLMYLVLVQLLSNERTLHKAVVLFLMVGTLTSLFGILARWLYAFGLNLGVQIDPSTKEPIPYGTLWEGNIFGSYTMSFALCFLALLSTSEIRKRHRLVLWSGFIVNFSATLLSLSRGAYLGFAGGLLMIFLFVRKNFLRRWFFAITIVGLLLLISYGSLTVDESRSPIITRALSLSNFTEASWQGRLYYYQQALDSWKVHPLIGWGTGSFGQLYTYVTVKLPAWVGNLEIRMLHDSGFLGVCAFVLFLIMVIGNAMRAVVKTRTSFNRNLLITFLVSFIGLLIAYQATEATWLGFTWVHIAFLRVSTRAVLENSANGKVPQASARLDMAVANSRDRCSIIPGSR